MSWFTASHDNVSADARGALVRVLAADRTRTAGAGVYLSGRKLLTCAHVVNAALGRPVLTPDNPGAVHLGIAFPVLSAVDERPVRLVAWVPPRPLNRHGPVLDGSLEWEGDLAVLELDEEPPAPVGPIPWREMQRGQQVRAWYGGGQAFSYADVLVGDWDGRIGYLDGQLSGAAVDEGYSGGPLFSLDDGAAVGLVMGRVAAPAGPLSAQHTLRRSWGMGWQSVLRELALVGAAPDTCERGPATGYASSGASGMRGTRGFAGDESVRDMMVGPLHSLLANPAARLDHASALAIELGLRTRADGSAPTVEQLADLLCATQRALPTLSESLAPTLSGAHGRGELNRLLALGRLTEVARLLSVAEHRFLLAKLEHLTQHDPGLVPRAATAALPYVDLPRSLQAARLAVSAVPAALLELEGRYGDGSPVPDESPRLPALLRVVEYVAAQAPGMACQALQEWSGRVAARLGIHASALAERRADAARWSARATATGVRVLVELDRHDKDPADRYRCSVWRMRADGTAARTVTATERPRTGREIARLIREVAGGAEGDGIALVAVTVTPDALELPVDEWDGADADEYIRAPLGEDFHLVLRCPQIRRRSSTGVRDLKRRWNARHQSDMLVADHGIGEETQLVRLLKTTHRDTARVFVHGSAARRSQLVRYCLAMGVPVVLWDREAAGTDDSRRLDTARPDGPVDELPERVRHFRVDAYADKAVAARPTLVWEDAGLPLPDELELADPAQGDGSFGDPMTGTEQAI
ncbi:trypsin-like peptidase domain-containing protein [Streptomyces sp. NPDC051956]|uniref:VMAP-C domain-containing protein n=1 Tax=Streptomyces sp. NPDC051956 TaxID=3365677 RepID=UPI0037CF0DDD